MNPSHPAQNEPRIPGAAKYALAHVPFARWIPVLAFVTVFVGIVVFAAVRDEELAPERVIPPEVLFGALIALLALPTWLLWRRRVRNELRWLSSLPFELDRQAYFALLAEPPVHADVTVTIRFRDPPPPDAKDQLAASVDSALPKSSVRWKKDQRQQLVIQSWGAAAKKGDFPDSGRLHRWFRRCVDLVLLDLHGRYPIAAVELGTD